MIRLLFRGGWFWELVSAGSSIGSTAAYVVSLLVSVAVMVLYVSLFALPLIWLLNR